MMDNQLLTLSKIFTERLFRIPDYQRGYAWTEKQLKDFWTDIDQLEPGRNHYANVLTLEKVPEQKYSRWDDDLWIIDRRNYQPYYIVDGQQRLTTSIILIQAITEKLKNNQKLNFTSKEDIQKKFIYDSKDDGVSRSYIFGYEKDNPSYNFLKSRIFCEHIFGRIEETVYTQNLERAKSYFIERTENMDAERLEDLYKKITQNLLFNIFTISEDVDVCVAFETMNNRGKPLSYLELLKNRLIYLSTKFDADDYARNKLRASINECWKDIYHSLGRNKNNPLNDDRFLITHCLVYFRKVEKEEHNNRYYRMMDSEGYAASLLEKRFIAKNITNETSPETKITLVAIHEYVQSLQESVKLWYGILNPNDSDFDQDTVIWLDKVNRIGADIALPLILTFMQNVTDPQSRVHFLQAIERALFIRSLRWYYPDNYFPFPLYLNLAIKMHAGESSAEKIIKHISDETSALLKKDTFWRDVASRFRTDGYYKWVTIRYFLYEYNLSLQEKSKSDRPKIFWPEFTEDKKDFVSVEHIYPQQARHPYWTTRFHDLSQKRREALRDSLGNLLPLSKPKNASLSNKPFPDKVKSKVGTYISYCYGCYAENEVAQYSEWNPENILERGIKMLNFMEKRWSITIGDEAKKRNMLGI